VTTASLSGPAGRNGWYVGGVEVTLSATDPDGADDIAATRYTVDGGAPQVYAHPFTVSGDAVHEIAFWTETWHWSRAATTRTVTDVTIRSS
jgi:hypothetical protein